MKIDFSKFAKSFTYKLFGRSDRLKFSRDKFQEIVELCYITGKMECYADIMIKTDFEKLSSQEILGEMQISYTELINKYRLEHASKYLGKSDLNEVVDDLNIIKKEGVSGYTSKMLGAR